MGVEVKLLECIAKVEFNVTQYFFVSKIINGIFGTGQGEEYSGIKRDRGTYLPIWVDIKRLSSLNVKPKEVALKIHSISS